MTNEIPWLSYEYSRPQQDLPIIIECRGRERNYETVIVPGDLPPEFNVANLRWRPTGIFRELGGRVDDFRDLAGQQANALGLGSGFCGGFAGLLGSVGAGLGYAAGEWLESSLAAPQKSREELGVLYPGEKRKWL